MKCPKCYYLSDDVEDFNEQIVSKGHGKHKGESAWWVKYWYECPFCHHDWYEEDCSI